MNGPVVGNLDLRLLKSCFRQPSSRLNVPFKLPVISAIALLTARLATLCAAFVRICCAGNSTMNLFGPGAKCQSVGG